ncbi:MAG: bile acid:sodium symporter family protein [Synechococcus sp.]
MPPAASLLVTATVGLLMFSLELGLQAYPFVLIRDRPAFFWRVLLGTCLLVPLAGFLLVLLPLEGLLSRPAWTAMALMLVCPSASLILFRVRSTGGTAELAARLQIAAALLAILSVPAMALLLKAISGVEGWEIGPASVAVQVLQVLPVIAGVLLAQAQPRLAQRCSAVLGKLARLLLGVMLLALQILSGSQFLPFLRQNLPALAAMAGLSLMSLAMGYGLAGRDPLERRTVSLVTGMRNTGLAAALALTHARGMEGLIPGILAYVLITVIVSTLFLTWQRQEIPAVL